MNNFNDMNQRYSEMLLNIRNLKTHFFTESSIVKTVDGIDLKKKVNHSDLLENREAGRPLRHFQLWDYFRYMAES